MKRKYEYLDIAISRAEQKRLEKGHKVYRVVKTNGKFFDQHARVCLSLAGSKDERVKRRLRAILKEADKLRAQLPKHAKVR